MEKIKNGFVNQVNSLEFLDSIKGAPASKLLIFDGVDNLVFDEVNTLVMEYP